MAGPRADAQRNHERILEVARVVLREQGTQASLRDVARRAGVGLGTLYRHFPNRDALLESLMRRRFDHLRGRAESLAPPPGNPPVAEPAAAGTAAAGTAAAGPATPAGSRVTGSPPTSPGAALWTWLTEFAYCAGAYGGLPSSILATLADETSPLHPACEDLRRAAGRLLAAAQAAGEIRADVTVDELFAMVNAVGWIAERTPDEPRRLLTLITEGLAPRPA